MGGDRAARKWAADREGRSFIVANGLTTIRQRLQELREKLKPSTSSAVTKAAKKWSFQDKGKKQQMELLKYAQSVVETRSNDSREDQRQVLRRLITKGGNNLSDKVLDAVLDQAEEYLTDTQAFEFALPFPTLAQALSDPELKWRKKVQNPESLRNAILKAQELRDGISQERADDIGERFLLDDQNGSGDFLSRQTQKMRAVKDTMGFPLVFAAFIFFCLPEDATPTKRSFIHGYKTLTKKKSDWDKIQAIAWALGRTFGYAGTPIKEALVASPTEPVASPVEEAKVEEVVESAASEESVAAETSVAAVQTEASEDQVVAPAVEETPLQVQPLRRVLDTPLEAPTEPLAVTGGGLVTKLAMLDTVATKPEETESSDATEAVAEAVAEAPVEEAVEVEEVVEVEEATLSVDVETLFSSDLVAMRAAMEDNAAQMEAMRSEMASFRETVGTLRDVVASLQGVTEAFSKVADHLDARLTAKETGEGTSAVVEGLQEQMQEVLEAVRQHVPGAGASSPDMLQKLLDMGATIQIGGKPFPAK